MADPLAQLLLGRLAGGGMQTPPAMMNPLPMPNMSPVATPSINPAGGVPSIPAMPAAAPAAVVPPVPQNAGGGVGGLLSNFAEKVRTDPAFQQALLMFGSQLMQPIQPGQTGLGNLGKAFATSLGTLNQSRAAAAQQRLNEREIGVKEGMLGEEGRQFDAQKASREADVELKKAQAGYYNRMPDTSKGEGSAKVAEANTLAKALILAEKQAIAEGRLTPEQAKYQSNPNLATIDAIQRLNPNNATDPDAFEAGIRETIAPYIDLFSEKQLQELETQIADGRAKLAERDLTTRFTRTPSPGTGTGTGATGDFSSGATGATSSSSASGGKGDAAEKTRIFNLAKTHLANGVRRELIVKRLKDLGYTDAQIKAEGL